MKALQKAVRRTANSRKSMTRCVLIRDFVRDNRIGMSVASLGLGHVPSISHPFSSQPYPFPTNLSIELACKTRPEKRDASSDKWHLIDTTDFPKEKKKRS